MSLELWIACVLITDQRVSIFAKAAGHGAPWSIGEDCIALEYIVIATPYELQ